MHKKPEKAFILAAGFGTRMRPLTDERPKPMVEVAGRSLIWRILDKLQTAGICETVVNGHYKADMLQDHLQKYTLQNPAMHIHFSYEKEILGTGGGIKNALHYFENRPFYVIAGDSLWMDGAPLPALDRLAQHWDPKKTDILTMLHPVARMDLTRGVGDYDLDANGLMRRSHVQDGRYMWTNIRLNAAHIYDDVAAENFSFLEIMDMYEKKGRLYGLAHDGDWHHISTPQDLEAVHAAFCAEET